jgi:type IV fimbrial biogenesis protein FimT
MNQPLPHLQPPRLKRAAGVTLLELAVALAVLVVLGTLAVAPLNDRLQRQRLALAAETLAADLAEARFEAARRGHAVYAVAHAGTGAGTNWCWALDPGAAGAAHTAHTAPAPGADSNTACPTQALRLVQAQTHPGVRMARGGSLRIEAVGTTAAGTLAVFVSPKGERLRVDMLALGRARICSETGAQGRYPGC